MVSIRTRLAFAARTLASCMVVGGMVVGCNQGGIMELELLLPPAPSNFDLGPCAADGSCGEGVCESDRCVYRGEWHSQVEITSQFDFLDNTGLVNQWDLGQDARVSEIPLAGSASDQRWSCTSVLGSQAVRQVRVRLRYCRELPCVETLEGDTVEHWYEIEAPFYDGKRTYVRRRAPVVTRSRAQAPSSAVSCETSSDCTDSVDGPTCLSNLRCGCTADAQCGAGHCEGAQTVAGEGRCTTDIGRCQVAGCIVSDRLLDGPNLCLGIDTGMEEHPCETSPSEEYEPVGCYDGG